MIEALQEVGMAEPFPRAFDSDSYRLGVADPAPATGMLGQQARHLCRRPHGGMATVDDPREGRTGQ